MRIGLLLFCSLPAVLLAAAGPLNAQTTSQSSVPASAASGTPEGSGKLSFLPPQISQDLELNLWGWLGYGGVKSDAWETYWDGELQLDLTKSFNQRLAFTSDINFIDADNRRFGQLEQLFISVLLCEQSGTLLTIGKFNASFGVEPRDFWNRATGTTSLLFGAQPQDLIGVMVTQPIGTTGIKVRPFLVNQFSGRADFDQAPSAGLTIEYQPAHAWTFAVTGWAGPGFLPKETYSEYASAATSEYAAGGSSSYGYSAVVAGNWLGPDLEARRGGTLYFLDARASWLARPDLTLAVEGLFGTTGSSDGSASWGGLLALATYDITDRWRLFARWSYLNDANGLITGTVQRRHELSAGTGYEIYHNVEVRGEYRHDFSDNTDDLDTISVHLAFGL